MRRFFGLLAILTAAVGVFLLFPEGRSAHPPAVAGAGGAFGYGGWAVGLVMGFALAWLVGVEWSTLPERAGLWLRLQRRRLGWAVFGGLFAAILLLL